MIRDSFIAKGLSEIENMITSLPEPMEETTQADKSALYGTEFEEIDEEEYLESSQIITIELFCEDS